MYRPVSKPELVLAVLVTAALWFTVHPLVGLVHDSVLYLGQALARQQPDAFQADLFLSLSGQDRFTLATALTSRLHAVLGIGIVNTSLLLLTQCLSALLLLALIRPMIGARAAWLGLLLYACASNGYGPEQTFGFAEPFLTARSLAEPMVWGALLAWYASRRLLALALLVAASLMHPLIALPGWVVVWCALLRKDARWALLLVPILGSAVSFVLLGWPPQLAPFDAQWLLAIKQRNVVFLHQMDLADWCKAVLPAFTLALVVRRRAVGWAVSLAVLDAAVLLLGAAVVAADLLHSALPTQLQLWRGLWPMQALGLVLLPWLVMEQTRQPAPLQLCIRLAALAALTAVNASVPSGPWLISWWLLLSVVPTDKVTTAVARWVTFATGALLLSAVASSVDVMTAKAPRSIPYAVHQLWMPWFATPAVAVSLLLLAWYVAARKAWLTVVAGLGLLGASAALWDQRTGLMHAIENVRPPNTHPWQTLIPEQAPVLWPGHPEAIWALLHRPVFYDETQGAASVFNRELAITFARRQEYFSAIRQAEIQCQLQHLMLRQPGQPACSTPMSSFGALCGTVPGLRFFVGTERWSPAWVSSWRLPDAPGDHAGFHLHDCERLQHAAPSGAESHPLI